MLGARPDEARLRAIIERLADGIIIVDSEGMVRFANPAAEALFGLPAGELVGAPFGFPVVAGEAAEIDLIQRGGSAVTAELRIVETEWEGEPASLISVRDLSERAQSEERARLLEAERAARVAAEAAADRTARLQAVTSQLSGAVTAEDVARVLVTAGIDALGADAGVVGILNPSASALRLVRADYYGSDFFAVRESVPLSVEVPITDAVRRGEAVFASSAAERNARYPMPGPPGFEAVAAAPFVVEGRALGAWTLHFRCARVFSPDDRAFLVTVTQQCAQSLERARLYEAERAARAEAEAANRAKTDFLAVMSHELRTPLNAIAGYAELMELGIHGPVTDAQVEDLRRIQRNQRHLLSLINDVLNFAKIEAGRVDIRLADIPLHEPLSGVEALVGPQFRARDLRYEYRAPDPALSVRADPEKLRQILLNLLSNAVKFTRSGGQVTLECGPDSERVFVRVRDTGRGIPAHKLEHIFEPFVQVDTRLSRTEEGVGLGLAISRDLARAMGGDLTAESTLGMGSTFTLTLPRAQARAD